MAPRPVRKTRMPLPLTRLTARAQGKIGGRRCVAPAPSRLGEHMRTTEGPSPVRRRGLRRPADGARTAGPTTLPFVNAQDPGTFDKLIAGFEKANPTIKIKLQTLPYDALNAAVLSRLGQKDASIDVYEVDEPRVAAFATRG